MSDELVAFLRARWIEDERLADTGAPGQRQWVYRTTDVHRRILDLHWTIEDTTSFEGEPYTIGYCRQCNEPVCTTLRLLAEPYVAHPDYRDEWRP